MTTVPVRVNLPNISRRVVFLVYATALVNAFIALIVSFGLNVTVAQAAAIQSAVNATIVFAGYSIQLLLRWRSKWQA